MSRPVRLSELLSGERDPESPVAFTGSGPVSRGELRRRTAVLAAGLNEHPGGRWLLACESTVSFAAGLLALWQTDRTAVLPANLAPGSIEEAASGTAGAVSDLRALPAAGPVLHPGTGGAAGLAFRALDRSFPCLELYTSGSAGERKRVAKSLSQLEDEAAALERAFGPRLGACAVLGTVSHQHIYGLLFRLLWPLCAGRPFVDEPLLHWGELFDALRRFSPCALAATPAHLSRLPQGAALGKGRCRALFSSGGRLDPADALRAGEALGAEAVDVLGSTETGGVGWREPAKDAGLWTPLPGVKVVELPGAAGPRLGVVSPFASSSEGGAPVLLGNMGRRDSDGRFRLGARADRVVKIAEKRLSLDEAERCLEGGGLVAQAALVRLPGARGGLGAVVRLNAAGRARLAELGRAGLCRELRGLLSRRFDAATLPRRFRFTESIPADERGKVFAPGLLLLFAPTAPQELESRREGDSWVKRLKVPADLAYTDGHFPGRPVVPGAVQLRWAADAASGFLGGDASLTRVDSVKFKSPLLPGEEFLLRIRPGGGREFRFTLEACHGGRTISTGRCAL